MKNSSIGFTAILVLSLFIGVTLVTPDEQPPEVPPTPLHFDRYAFFAPAADSIVRPEKPLIKPDVLEFYWNTFVPVYLDHVTLPTTDVVLTSLGNYYITGYTSIECGGSTTTASGTTCHKAASYEDSFENPTTCAIDPALHDFSDVFFIEPFGYFIAEDTGSAVKSKHLDLFYGTTMTDYYDALAITGYYEVFQVEYVYGSVQASKYDVIQLIKDEFRDQAYFDLIGGE